MQREVAGGAGKKLGRRGVYLLRRGWVWSGRKKGEGTRLTIIKGLTVWDIPRRGRGGGGIFGPYKMRAVLDGYII